MDLNKIVTNSLLFNYGNQDMIKATFKFERNYLRTMFYKLKLKRYYNQDIY
jgi:hypothetical protein